MKRGGGMKGSRGVKGWEGGVGKWGSGKGRWGSKRVGEWGRYASEEVECRSRKGTRGERSEGARKRVSENREVSGGE